MGADAPYCGVCGTPLGAGAPLLELVLPDSERLVLAQTLTIGRTPANAIQLDDASVSRTHARIVVTNGRATLEDAGSSHGTWFDGQRVDGAVPLRAGGVIRLGDAELRVEAPINGAGAGQTLVVPAGASIMVPAAGPAELTAPSVPPGLRPRVASGWALKRLDASEGEKRYILRNLNGGDFVRMTGQDARLFELIDGSRTIPELIGEAERLDGPAGPGRLARLLADLGDRGLLAGVAGRQAAAPTGRLARLFRPRERVLSGTGPWFTRVYRRGAWVLFTDPALVVITILACAGIGVFAYLVAGRYGTPFVVASKIGLGGLVFLLGRFAVVAIHECAHALTMVSFGRKVVKVGIKVVLVFPYAFVDTSEAWFEPRRRRIAVSAAGPLSDLLVGSLFGIACLVAAPGTLRDIFFQLAFAAYVGAFFNLNPFLDRDGYQILVDVLREPGLRRRSREQFQRLLSGGERRASDTPALMRFAAAGIVWSALAAGFAIALSTRYYSVLEQLAPPGVVWAAFACLYLMLFVPVVWSLARPLWQRGERLPTEVKRVRI
ncbi:MAG TPA: FHA domain-containing protein [Solirubrobacteraceae bacterium]